MDLRSLPTPSGRERILVLGDVFIDEYLQGDCTRISPEAPVPILHVSAARQVLGGAANTAHNIAALGARAVLIGLVGRDAGAGELAALCARVGIDFHPVVDARPTIRKVRLMGQRQQLLRLDYEETVPADAARSAEILRLFDAQVGQADMVILSDYAKGFLTGELCRELITRTHAAGKEILIDPRPQHAAFYRGCDYLTPNWKEALGLLGRGETQASEALEDEVGRELSRRLGANILLTLGPRGISFYGREGTAFRMPTLAREVFDVSGAGDTVVATFALGKSLGLGLREAVTLANRAAGLVVAKVGTATVGWEELVRPDGHEARLVARAGLAPLAAELRSRGKTLVTLNGSFDLLHAGHLHILEEARRQGDVLLVGLNSDASVRRYKGPDRPLIGQDDRARMLLALRCVDYVHIFDEDVPMPFLEEVRPHVHVNGSEYGPDCVEAPTVRKHGGRIHIVEKLPGLSTSALVAKIKSLPA